VNQQRIRHNTIEDLQLQADPTWNGVYRVGGICALITGPLWIIAAGLSILIGPAPSASEAYLQAVGGHIILSQMNFGIFILTDFLLLPVVLALYLALKQQAKNAMLIAAALLLLYLVVDLAVTEMNSIVLITLTQQYAAATSDAQRSALAAAANYALANLPLATFYSFFVSSVGWLIVSIVMLKGIFSRLSAWMGIILSGMGIAGSFYGILPVFGIFLSQCLVAFGIWCLLVGVRLLKLGKAVPIARTTPIPVSN
jgi:hypothetical protein